MTVMRGEPLPALSIMGVLWLPAYLSRRGERQPRTTTTLEAGLVPGKGGGATSTLLGGA